MKKDDLIGLLTALLLAGLFITLKLLDVIAWGWLAVTSPLWFPPVAVLLLFAVYVALDLFGPQDPNDENNF